MPTCTASQRGVAHTTPLEQTESIVNTSSWNVTPHQSCGFKFDMVLAFATYHACRAVLLLLVFKSKQFGCRLFHVVSTREVSSDFQPISTKPVTSQQRGCRHPDQQNYQGSQKSSRSCGDQAPPTAWGTLRGRRARKWWGKTPGTPSCCLLSSRPCHPAGLRRLGASVSPE